MTLLQNNFSYSLIFTFVFQCHSGVLGGGHYISYNKSTAGKWYCLNDSACKVSKKKKVFLNFFCFFKIENIFLFSFRKSKKRPWKRELLTCFFMRERAYQFLIIYPKLTRSFCPIQKISKMSLKLILKNIAALCNIFFVSIVFLYKKSNSYVHAQAFLKSSFN